MKYHMAIQNIIPLFLLMLMSFHSILNNTDIIRKYVIFNLIFTNIHVCLGRSLKGYVPKS